MLLELSACLGATYAFPLILRQVKNKGRLQGPGRVGS